MTLFTYPLTPGPTQRRARVGLPGAAVLVVVAITLGSCAVTPRSPVVDYVGEPTPIGGAELPAGEAVGAYYAELASASTPGLQIVLVLYDGGDARMQTDFLDGRLPVVEVGAWRVERMAVVVDLTGAPGDADYGPRSFVFDMVDATLSAIDGEPDAPLVDFVLTRYTSNPTPHLAGTAWSLSAIEMMDGTVLDAGDDDRYTARFMIDGSFAARADCNRVAGRYADIDSRLGFDALASTRVACAADSLYDRYVRALDDAHSFVRADGELFVAFGPDSGILRFRPLE